MSFLDHDDAAGAWQLTQNLEYKRIDYFRPNQVRAQKIGINSDKGAKPNGESDKS